MRHLTYIPGAGWCWPVRRQVPYAMRTALQGRTLPGKYTPAVRPLTLAERKERYDNALAIFGLPEGWFDYE